ncbi:MAG: tRNA 2-thiocytidine biosynthesis protein TtcA [Clostridia bacterium]|jgi:tRNA(Ile)-lysidine synthase TilS/MesJ|nr:tRNA 2-thiocytidine biosynthesis protein TtcA [Clostridia bacterium]MDF2889992.1 tRNA 2-thiocytidine biosynthesis protein TtcA [Clostridia bacterium]
MSGIAGSGCDVLLPLGELKPLNEIERSIIKGYRKVLLSKFIRAIKDYKMIADGDRVAVAMSGGKDSLVMAKLFQELQKHGTIKFELEFIVMDPGYHENIKELLISNCKHLEIPIQIFESYIFDVVDRIAKDYPCYMCAKMRRGALYNKAQELGCNKMALGHHFNDVIETTFLNIAYTGSFKTMLPKLKSTNFAGLELIRPMYYIEEKDIISFTQNSGIQALNCACMVAAKKIGNKRYEIRALIEELKGRFENFDKKLFKAAENVNMEAILGWQKGDKKYSYLDFYDGEDCDEE